MALMVKHKQEKNYVEVPNETAQAPEKKTPQKSISLQSLGLITNLWSHDVETFEVHKTELYKRFEKNKETSVRGCWAELVEAKYILEYKIRVGKENDYIYIYNIKPFTSAEIEEYNAQVLRDYGSFSGLDFQDLKIRTSFSGPQNHVLLNTKLNKDLTKKDLTKEKNISLVSTADMDSIDSVFKSIFPDMPIDEFRAEIIHYVENGALACKSQKQYKGLMQLRVDNWLKRQNAPTPPRKSRAGSKRPTRTELLPDWFDKPDEPIQPSESQDNEDIARKKREIEEMLKAIDEK
jgi:hypothetical protein